MGRAHGRFSYIDIAVHSVLVFGSMKSLAAKRTNDEWIASLRAHDARALEELCQYLCRNLQKTLAGRPGQSDAEDFAQQAVQRILESLDRFRGDSKFTTWANAIAIRIALSELRKKQWGTLSLDAFLENARAAESLGHTTPPSGHTNSAREEILSALRIGIETVLTERQRSIVLGELHGMPAAVLCAQLGMTRGAAYKMHFDARKRLRKHLEEAGFSIEDVRFVLDGASND